MNKLLKTLVVATMLASPLAVFAQGGNNPIEGIDIIIKEDPSQAPIRPISLTGGELKKYNSMKASGRAIYLSKFVSERMNKITDGANPKDGWQKLLHSSLASEWCAPCKMVAFTVHAETKETKYKITFNPIINK
ncbi:MAG: hypothetical protein OCD03_14975 [Hyphomicrobiales bacterium]